jgi:hypothetical protein
MRHRLLVQATHEQQIDNPKVASLELFNARPHLGPTSGSQAILRLLFQLK